MTISKDHKFTITLDSNPTTGFRWSAIFDQNLATILGTALATIIASTLE